MVIFTGHVCKFRGSPRQFWPVFPQKSLWGALAGVGFTPIFKAFPSRDPQNRPPRDPPEGPPRTPLFGPPGPPGPPFWTPPPPRGGFWPFLGVSLKNVKNVVFWHFWGFLIFGHFLMFLGVQILTVFRHHFWGDFWGHFLGQFLVIFLIKKRVIFWPQNYDVFQSHFSMFIIIKLFIVFHQTSSLFSSKSVHWFLQNHSLFFIKMCSLFLMFSLIMVKKCSWFSLENDESVQESFIVFLHIHQRKCSIMKRKHHIFWCKLLRFYLFVLSVLFFCRKFCKVIWCSSVNSSEFFYDHFSLQRSEFHIIPLLHRCKRERSAKHLERCNVAWFQKDSYELTELHHITLRNFLQS